VWAGPTQEKKIKMFLILDLFTTISYIKNRKEKIL